MSAVKILRCRPLTTGPMRAFLAVELASGLVINDIRLMATEAGEFWLAMPSVKAIDRAGNPILNAKGKPLYSNFVEFRDRETRDRFTTLVIAAVREANPEVFCDGGGL